MQSALLSTEQSNQNKKSLRTEGEAFLGHIKPMLGKAPYVDHGQNFLCHYKLPISLYLINSGGRLSLNNTGSALNSTVFSGIIPYISAMVLTHSDLATRCLRSADNASCEVQSAHLNFCIGATFIGASPVTFAIRKFMAISSQFM